MTEKRSQVWSMVNWAHISINVKRRTTISPNHATIDEAIRILEQKHEDMQLFLMEANELEKLLIGTIVELLQRRHGKDIKKNIANRERSRKMKAQQMKNTPFDVKVVPFGKMGDLKDMGIDPETMEKLSNSLMEQLFGKKKKKKDKDDEDDDDDPGASFYL